MDAFTNVLESRMSSANQFPNPLRCVRPKIVEVTMITWGDRLEALQFEDSCYPRIRCWVQLEEDLDFASVQLSI